MHNLLRSGPLSTPAPNPLPPLEPPEGSSAACVTHHPWLARASVLAQVSNKVLEDKLDLLGRLQRAGLVEGKETRSVLERVQRRRKRLVLRYRLK